MPTIQAQTWKTSPFTIERSEGKASGTVIFRFHGPFTARDMYSSLTPDSLNNILDLQPATDDEHPLLNILDLTDVPYMDSSGLAVIVRHYVRCKSKGVTLIVAGADARVLDLFQLTKVDGLIRTAATVEEAESR
jgi:anti-anti-sigma factor